jgi:hypothetical protein
MAALNFSPPSLPPFRDPLHKSQLLYRLSYRPIAIYFGLMRPECVQFHLAGADYCRSIIKTRRGTRPGNQSDLKSRRVNGNGHGGSLISGRFLRLLLCLVKISEGE